MRGGEDLSRVRFSDVDLEARVPATHPLRTIRGIDHRVWNASTVSGNLDRLLVGDVAAPHFGPSASTAP